MRIWLLACALAACASGATAADITRTASGVTYFNKPGADLASHDADVAGCRKIAERLHQPAPRTTVVAAGGVYGAIGVAIGIAIAQAVNDARAHPINVENCMVVRGWRVVSLSKEEGDTIAALDHKAKLAKLADWIGATEPHGVIVRTYANELGAEAPESVLIASGVFGNTALSADIAAKPSTAGAHPAPAAPEMQKSARPPKPLKAQDLGGVPVGDAVVVVSVGGAGPIRLEFQRTGPDADTPAWVDGRPGSFVATQSPTNTASVAAGSGLVLAFAVPPGRWRLAFESNGEVAASFCLGSPAFDVAAGDVIYAGSFDPAALGHPDLSLDQAKAIFPSMSGLGDRIRPASYVNGTTGVCSGAYAYALEFADRPFADGYAWGSRAAAPAPALAAQPAAIPPAPMAAVPPPAPPATQVSAANGPAAGAPPGAAATAAPSRP